MPEFKDREEYEQWKAERLKQAQKKDDAGDTEKSTSPAPPSQKSASPISSSGLSEIGDLLTRAWEQFRARLWVLLPLQLLSIAFLAACTAAVVGIGALFVLLLPSYKDPILIISVIIGLTAGITAMFWPIAALVIAVADSSLGIKEALAAGWKKLWAFLWLFSIIGYIIAGGYLLFIVPGIIFTVWFIFAQYILASEHTGGMNALLRSKAYVKDRWFDVCIRLLVMWAISAGVGMVPFLGVILALLITPFSMIYSYLIYEELKALSPAPLDYKNTTGEKLTWIGIATLGYIVLPLIIIALVGAACMVPLLILKGMAVPHPPQKFF